MHKKIVRAFIVLAFSALAALIAALLVSCAPNKNAETPAQLSAEDTPYTWVLNYNQDMQLPELPTGCEATAASTLMRMNGTYITKQEVADAMPKSETDFVYSFLGDPYSYEGWATSAPCVVETINGFYAEENTFAAVELTGTPLDLLPLPAVVWVTIELKEPQPPVREVDGYGLFKNSHCVVVRKVTPTSVDVIDPLGGDPTYDRAPFERAYNAMGMQAVYITDVQSAIELKDDMGVG